MKIRLYNVTLVASGALLCAGPAFSQTTQVAAVTSAPVAVVYVQGLYGVYVYDASTTGQLTAIAGSPFADTGQMEGVEGGYLISVGTDYLHSYHLGSNGSVGSQASEINTQSYSGSECGTTEGPALLDHSGAYFAVQLAGSSSISCSALQTYKIGSNGQFTFLGAQLSTLGYHDQTYEQTISTYSSNDLFAYGVQGQVYADLFLAFKRAAAGDLVTDSGYTQTGPVSDPSVADSSYFPVAIAADPANHLAAAMNMPFSENSNTFQLASFTINNTTGAIQSTNTYANMPTLQVYPTSMGMSWDGTLLAVGGCPGLELFHFNGASPPTAFGPPLPINVCFDHVAWDKSDHLYAIGYGSQELYVFTVTQSGIVLAPGSPYQLNNAYGVDGLIVVPKN
jgi:hypothetical protein